MISGKDKGKKAKVLEVFPKEAKITVEGVNMVKKNQRPRRQGEKAGIIEKNMPIHVSNVAIADPKTEKPTRIGYGVKNGKKVRISKKSGSALN